MFALVVPVSIMSDRHESQVDSNFFSNEDISAKQEESMTLQNRVRRQYVST